MKKSEIEKFIQPLKNISLSCDERERMRQRLGEYVEFKPAREPVGVLEFKPAAVWVVVRDHFQQVIAGRHLLHGAVAAVLMLAISGGATIAAAENSLPGDLLYPIKIGVTENIMQLVAVTPESDARAHSRIVERRIQEVEELTVSNKLDEQAEVSLRQQIMSHTERATDLIDQLESSGNEELAMTVGSDFVATLRAHAQVLADLSAVIDSTPRDTNDSSATGDGDSVGLLHSAAESVEESSTSNNSKLSGLISHVRTVADKLTADAASGTSRTVTSAELRSELERASTALQNAEIALSQVGTNLDQAVVTRVEGELRQAAELIEDGLENLGENDEIEAQEQIIAALDLSKTASTVLKIHTQLRHSSGTTQTSVNAVSLDQSDNVSTSTESTDKSSSEEESNDEEDEGDVLGIAEAESASSSLTQSASSTATSSEQASSTVTTSSSTDSLVDGVVTAPSSAVEGTSTAPNTSSMDQPADIDSEEEDEVKDNRNPVPTRGVDSEGSIGVSHGLLEPVDESDSRNLNEVVVSVVQKVDDYLADSVNVTSTDATTTEEQ